MEKTREVWIDNAKMIAILLVVISHCFHFFSLQPYEAYFIRPFVNSFNMHLFAMISGFTAMSSISKINSMGNFATYVEKIAMRIALPCLLYCSLGGVIQKFAAGDYFSIWTIALLFCLLIVFLTIYQPDKELLLKLSKYAIVIYCLSPYADWFFRFLITCLLLFAVVNYISKVFKLSNVYVYFVFLVLAFVIPVKELSELVIPFCIGNILANKSVLNINDRMSTTGKRFLLFILPLVGLFFFYLAYYRYGSTSETTFYTTTYLDLYKKGLFQVFIFRQFNGLIWSLWIVLITYISSKSYTWFSRWGKWTLPIYGIHCLLLHGLSRLPNMDIRPQILFIVASTFAGLGLTAVTCSIIPIINRSKVLRMAFMGEH